MEHESHRDDAQSPYSDETCNESRGMRESRRFPECNNVQHVLTIGSQTRGGSTGCVGDREVIDQLLDDQMNHVSSAKRVY